MKPIESFTLEWEFREDLFERGWLDDLRHFPYSPVLGDILMYFPVLCFVVRSLKSETIC